MKRGVRKLTPRALALAGVAASLCALAIALAGCTLFNKFPIAGFTVGPSTTGPAPFTVTLSAAPSSDPDGDPLTYAWDYGDGGSGSGKSVAHTFNGPGTFTVVLTVSDGKGGSDDAAKAIYVTDPEPAGPTASFTASPTSGTSPLSVTFDASASTYEGGAISAYEWTFGDGGTWSGKTAQHTYFSAGNQTFTVTLTVRGTDNKTAVATKSIAVTVPGGGGPPPSGSPSARFDVLFEDPDVVGDAYTNHTVAPVRVWLDPSESEADTGRTIASYSWSFGDGTAATSISPDVQEHVYVTNLTSKTFSATLVVIDDEGAIDTVTKTVKVENYQPVAGFQVSDEDNVLASTQPNAEDEWWMDDEDGLDDDRVTYKTVTPGDVTVWIRSKEIVDGDYLAMNNTNPVPNSKSGEPAEYNDEDGPNMSFDREGQTWAGGTKPTWFPNRAWGIQTLKVEWGDFTTDYIPYVDGADTTASHDYDFAAGGVKSWTITVTAIDFLGNERSFSRTITMNEGG